ncbi:Ig-like domain-containing protein [Colwellia piezophila]|uniref:Ig-like domain-containing protein n=1 Tax=Colwellia piezophila TaxID=211668 RepID=UPI00036E116F|nr:Ig-like domain-containing protein [Colwellia piezophila]
MKTLLLAAIFLLNCLLSLTAQSFEWQQHDAPAPIWQIAPKIENGIQTGLFLGAQDNHVYSLDSNGDTLWSFDTKGLPSQLISADLVGDSKAEVIVATHDDAGTLYVLSDTGAILSRYVHGVPFATIGVSTEGSGKIFGATYDGIVFFFDTNLTVIKKHTWNYPSTVWNKPDTWYQALKVGDVTGDGKDDVVVLDNKGVVSVFNTNGSRIAYDKLGSSGKRGDLFLVNINNDAKQEIIIISAGVVNNNYTLAYEGDDENGNLSILWTFGDITTSAGMALIDDFLPADGLDVLAFDPSVFENNVFVQGLDADGFTLRNKTRIYKENMRLPLTVTLSADKATIIAGSVGTRDNSYYTIASSDFESENYPLLPEVNLTAPALATLADSIQLLDDIPLKEGAKPHVLFIRGNANPDYRDMQKDFSDIMKAFEALAPNVKVVLEIPVNTKTKMTHQQLLDLTDWLEDEDIAFTFEISSGSSPANISMAEVAEVLERAPNSCYGFATAENARYARAENDPWKEVFFPMVLEVAQLVKAKGKTINVQENQAGWAIYAGDPDVISQWFAPELKGTIIPIARNNANGAYLAYNALLGLETAGFTDGWGVSIQDWMWVDQSKHLIPGMVPRELMTRANMMAAAMGARYFQFEHGVPAIEDMKKITSNPNSPWNPQEDAVFFQYLRKGIFPGYHSNQLKNLSSTAIGLEYNDDLWQKIEDQWFLGLWDFNANSELNSGVLGQHTGLQPLPEKNIYKYVYEIKYNRANNFKTPYGLVPIVPSPYAKRAGAVDFDLIKTDRHVYLGSDTKYLDKNTLLNAFEVAASHHPFRSNDAFMAVYEHSLYENSVDENSPNENSTGYLLYIVGTEYFTMDDGVVTIEAGDQIEILSVEDYATGQNISVNGNEIQTTIPGGVIRVLYVKTNTTLIAVTGIAISNQNGAFHVGDTQQLSASITPSNAANISVTWSSNNSAVATVNSTGKVTAVSAGTAKITVTSVDGSFTASTTITVTTAVVTDIAVTGISLSSQSGTLYINNTLQLSATITPDNATNTNVTWSSDNSAVVTVSSNGLVTAVKNGTATITVTSTDGSFTANTTITISQKATPPNNTEDSNGGGGSFSFAGILMMMGLLARPRLQVFLPRSYGKK